MQNFKTLFSAFAVALALLTSPSSNAQSAAGMTRGEIRKVDKDAGKITIKHEEIKSLEMPPMTMVFTVKDRSLLEKAREGDKVEFSVVREDGKLMVTELQRLGTAAAMPD